MKQQQHCFEYIFFLRIARHFALVFKNFQLVIFANCSDNHDVKIHSGKHSSTVSYRFIALVHFTLLLGVPTCIACVILANSHGSVRHKVLLLLMYLNMLRVALLKC